MLPDGGPTSLTRGVGSPIFTPMSDDMETLIIENQDRKFCFIDGKPCDVRCMAYNAEDRDCRIVASLELFSVSFAPPIPPRPISTER